MIIAEVPRPTKEIKQHETPKHYDGAIEPIAFFGSYMTRDRFLGGCLMQVMEYIIRSDKKGNELQDLKKARDFLNFAIDYLESEQK